MFMSVERTVVVSSSCSLVSSSIPSRDQAAWRPPETRAGAWLRRTIAGGSGEGKILHHTLVVCGANNNGFGQRALTLAVLALKQVTLSLFAAQDLPRARHLESFGDGLTGLCFTCGPWHGAGRLGTDRPLAREKWLFFPRMRRVSVLRGPETRCFGRQSAGRPLSGQALGASGQGKSSAHCVRKLWIHSALFASKAPKLEALSMF